MDEASNNGAAITDTPEPAAQQETETTAGELLKAMRERAGVELETIATTLKVSPQKLRALEANDFSVLPAAFVRALTASVCRHLGQDPAPVLEKIPNDKPATRTSNETTQTPHHAEAVISANMRRRSVARPVWLVAGMVLLLAAAAALFAFPSLGNLASNAIRGQTPQASAESSPASSAAAEHNTIAPDEAASAATTHAIQPASVAASEATPAASQPAASGSTPQAAAGDASAAIGSSTLQINATGNTWVKVSSSSGKTLYRRNLVAGQTHNVPITKYPVQVEVGKAENTLITDRGTPLDLSVFASQGYASFELNP